MGPYFALDVLSRIIHIGTAICLVGGSVFSLFVVLPVFRTLEAETRTRLLTGLTSYWKRFVHFGIVLMLLSGFYNYFQQIVLHKGDGQYHMLIGIKMLLAFAIFFIASALVGRSAKLQPMRNGRGKWLSILVGIAAVIVIISGYLKMRGVPVDVQLENKAVLAETASR